MNEKLNNDIYLLNRANEAGVLPLLFVNLISSDYLINVDTCDKSIEMLSDFMKALPYTNIVEKEKWIEKCETGIKIAERDKKLFEGNTTQS